MERSTKDKKSDLGKYFEILFDSDIMRYVDSKKVYRALKQNLKNETKENANINSYSDFLKDSELEKVANIIWNNN